MEKMDIYNKARSVPEEAKKPINAGRLKGMTDINPMYRIQRLTELFGPCGIGWWYEIMNKELVDDERTKQTAAFVDVLLYYRDPETGEPSRGIPGTGGASFVAQERNGAYLSDECYKMALTDALSVAAKALGVGADVYWAKGTTKYTETRGKTAEAPPQAPEPPKENPPAEIRHICTDCGKTIEAVLYDGKRYSATAIARTSVQRFGRPLCFDCYRKWIEAEPRENAV